ncbi:lipid II:glycine glycyltransferase FemX [Halorarum halobium]|uniref:lipid II:glycine glycyltransferase FemX n=1 Tax=Halorarum halobium TaxID=3075121 RepID=UPI0028A75A52|nr:GNAT family N-acetyltransferase [Halobaculum sp. XH14]
MPGLSATVYESIDAVAANQWNHIVEQSDRGSIYQRTEWLAALEQGLDLNGKHVVIEKNAEPVGVFPNLVVPLRLPDTVREQVPDLIIERAKELASTRPGFGGPVLASNERKALELALSRLDAACGPKILSHYVRSPDVDYIRYAEQFEAQGYTPNVSRCRPVIDLNREYDDILANMHKDRRYNIRKARENNAEIVIQPPTIDVLRRFHAIYKETLDRVGAEPQPFAVFREIAEQLDTAVQIVTAKLDGKPVGQHFYLLDEIQSAIRHEFSAVTADNFQYYPSELIHEHMMQWGQVEGYRTYDFGPTPSNHEDGLFSYKNQYGGTMLPILTWEQKQSPLWGLYAKTRTLYKRYSQEQ